MQTLYSFCSRFRGLSIFFLVLAAALLWGGTVSAQRGGGSRADSATRARQQALETARASRLRSLDSAKAERTRVFDSARVSRQRLLDSARAGRQAFSDSLAQVRKYRESRRYRDSVARSKQFRLDSVKSIRMASLDSARDARQRVTDSATASRKAALDAIRSIQKTRTDSLALIRKYRESRRYRDSVSVVRKSIADSIRETRQARVDSARASRQTLLAAAQAERKRVQDSALAVRTKYLDSLAAMRKVRADSLTKRKDERAKLAKEKEKKKKDLSQVKLQIAMKKKQEAYNNEKMLRKKWGFPRRPIQNLFTHYNYYFNANRKMEEAEANMQRVGKDNFEEVIPLFSFNPDRDSNLLASDMDSIILKASLGIQIHDPRTKWSDDLYLLLGQANYYKGNYEQATTAFRYIVAMRDRLKSERQKKAEAAERRRTKTVGSVVERDDNNILDFLQHEAATNDALLWLARTYTQSGSTNEAEAVIDVLLTDPKLPESLKGKLALEQAFLALKQNNNRDAARQLVTVAGDGSIPVHIRRRAAFLAGQLLEQQGQYAAAAAQFDRVSDMHPKIDMDFYARKYKAGNLVMAGGDQSATIASLKRLLNDGKYAPYYEQIYFLLGQSASVSGKRSEAINYLTKSTQSLRSTRKQKAVSFATLGHLYFSDGNYDLAKMAYDSASRFASAAGSDSAVNLAVRRASILESVAAPSRVIRTQDSLLALAALSEREQRTFVRRYLRGLQQRREDSIATAEQAGINSVARQDANAEPGTGNLSWYFSNANLMQQGYNDFKRKWGSRTLGDNWRRAAAIPVAGGPAGGGTGSGGVEGSNAVNVTDEADGLAATGGVQLDENGLPTEAYLLAQIPSTTERQNAARNQIQSAYMALGNAYVRQFEDYPRAIGTLDTFDARFAGHRYGDEEAYLRYLIALRQNNLNGAKQYADILQTRYADSKWARQVRPAEEGPGLQTADNGLTTAAIYEEAYSLLQQRQYGEVLSRVRQVQARADRRYTGKLSIMQAMALAGSASYDQADTVISQYLQSAPSDSLRLWAEAVQRYIGENRKANAPVLDSLQRQAGVAPAGAAPAGAAPAAVVPGAAAALPGTTAAVAVSDTPAVYKYRPAEPHYFVFVFGAVESKVQGVKVALGDFNRLRFSAQTLTNSLEPISPTQGLLFVKGFPSAATAKSYLSAFRSTAALTREFNPGEYQTVLISQSNYLKLMKDRNVPAYLSFYRSNYR